MMRRSVSLRLLSALLLLSALGGCVALAGPLIGGAIAAGASRTSSKPEPVEATAPTAVAATVGTYSDSAPGDSGELEPREPVATIFVASASASPANPAPAAGPIGKFGDFVQAQMARDPVLLPRLSAILREPSTLDGYREFCSALPVAVVIDLDPAGDIVDPEQLPEWGGALAPKLDELREEGLVIAWLSDLPASAETALRAALLVDGLDPLAADQLLLNDGDARKQLRREMLQQDHCIVAILGDELADFDELFDYLIKPEAAWQLDEMMEQGWFLAGGSGQATIPQPQPETE